MSSFGWTTDQSNAITTRNSSVLVSAAAGSGKTAVLVERLLRRICDEHLDITQFLIITYTKAAASELRAKISDALYKYASEHPGDKHIRRQIALVGSARISTVHSFCTWVLKNYANIPELAGGFRVFDEAEAKILCDEVLGELVEEEYEKGEKAFLELASYMSDARSDRQLYSAILELYNKSMSHPYPEKWLREMACSYDIGKNCNIAETVWGQEAMERAKKLISDSIEILDIVIDDVDRDADASTLYHDLLTELRYSIKKAQSDNWDELRENLCKVEFARRPSSRGLKNKEYVDRVKTHLDMVSDFIREKILGELLPDTSEQLVSEINALSGHMHTLSDVAIKLCDRFSKEKIRCGVLEYSDLEHYAIKLLIESYDEENDVVIPSETGLEVSSNFCEILLDEFQDSNIIQDIIFRSVSRDEKNIVMVGDVKQSIYGFRLADPSIFMKKYKTFARFEDAKGDESRCITLSQNFRSRKEVLDSANGIFSQIMSERLGGVDYNDDQKLVPRNDIPGAERTDMKCEFCLVDVVRGEEKRADAEARFVASKIAELVEDGFEIYGKDGKSKKAEYKDFAILLRSSSSSAEAYEFALSEFGIPFVSPLISGLLSKSEVNAVISYLSVIDNPTSEIPLVATLRSPLFGFSADDLCCIRRKVKNANLYDALTALAKDDGECAKKCREFMRELSSLRAISRGMSVGALIWEVYNRTNALGVFGAMSCGAERQRNLVSLYNCAKNFENSGYFGLYKFISHVASLAERGGDIAASGSHASNAVTIMTMHKSKGLEFPIVFIGSAIKSFNTDDIKKQILIHPKLGVGLKFRDEELGIECSTLMRDTIKRRVSEEQKSEEMRLLYVALTRAREKLFIVASLENAEKKLAKIILENSYPELDKISLERRNDAQQWFMLPLIRTTTGRALSEYAGFSGSETGEVEGMDAYVIHADDIPMPYEPEDDVADLVIEESKSCEGAYIPFEYPHVIATQTQSKVTATGISAVKNAERTIYRKRAERPSFMREKALTATERGTALHMAMQFADFKKCKTSEGATEELQRLYEEKYLTQSQKDAVSPEKISAFVNSDIGAEMLRAEKLCREVKFSVLVSAAEALGNIELSDERVLLQGVMDMYYETDDGITIVDFKTDKRRPNGEVLEKYSEQLRTYRRALYEMTGKDAKSLVLYLVSLGEYIEVE